MRLNKIIFFALAGLALLSCAREKVSHETRFALHTMVGLTLYEGESKDLFNDFFRELERENALVTNWLETSFASQIARSAGESPVVVTEERIYNLLKQSIELSRESQGKFNVLVAPLTYLWAIGTPEARVPSQEEIEGALKLIDLDQIIFNDEEATVYLTQKGMSFDLGAIGKGYLQDHMVAWLSERGVQQALLNFGGQLYLMGNRDPSWQVGLRVPESGGEERYFASLELPGNISLSTSGGYERFVEKDGKRYHHILDPVTGHPAQGDLQFVTVILPSALLADYYSTVGLVLGQEEGKKLFTEKGIPSIFVTTQDQVYLVGIAPQQFKLLDSSYTLVSEN